MNPVSTFASIKQNFSHEPLKKQLLRLLGVFPTVTIDEISKLTGLSRERIKVILSSPNTD